VKQSAAPEANAADRPLREVSCLFLKLGLIAFGGPAAHLALMEDEVVRRRRWLSHEEFLDGDHFVKLLSETFVEGADLAKAADYVSIAA